MSVARSNPHNMIKAAFEALGDVSSHKAIAAKRGKKVGELTRRREAPTEAAGASS